MHVLKPFFAWRKRVFRVSRCFPAFPSVSVSSSGRIAACFRSCSSSCGAAAVRVRCCCSLALLFCRFRCCPGVSRGPGVAGPFAALGVCLSCCPPVLRCCRGWMRSGPSCCSRPGRWAAGLLPILLSVPVVVVVSVPVVLMQICGRLVSVPVPALDADSAGPAWRRCVPAGCRAIKPCIIWIVYIHCLIRCIILPYKKPRFA